MTNIRVSYKYHLPYYLFVEKCFLTLCLCMLRLTPLFSGDLVICSRYLMLCICERLFCAWLVFCRDWFNFRKNDVLLVPFRPFGLNTPFIYAVLELLKYLKVIELIHFSMPSFMGNQLIFSNAFSKAIWALLFKFRQRRINLFCSICNLIVASEICHLLNVYYTISNIMTTDFSSFIFCVE